MSTAACGNGGRINFEPGFGNTQPTSNKPTSFSVVPASKALVVEDGKDVSTGYHAKVQLNPVKGLKMTATTGHSATMKYTVRNR